LPILILDGLLVRTGVPVMTVTMMMPVMGVYDHHNLSLHHIGHCKAEKESQSEPELFHTLL
jgi:hypothetical protein